MLNQKTEIEGIIKSLEKNKRYHLRQTNINEREDLSQELDVLVFEKLDKYMEELSPPTFYEYLKEEIKK